MGVFVGSKASYIATTPGSLGLSGKFIPELERFLDLWYIMGDLRRCDHQRTNFGGDRVRRRFGWLVG